MEYKQEILTARIYLDTFGHVLSSIIFVDSSGYGHSLDSKYFFPLFGKVKEKHWLKAKKWAKEHLELAEKHGSVKVVWPEILL